MYIIYTKAFKYIKKTLNPISVVNHDYSVKQKQHIRFIFQETDAKHIHYWIN